MNELAINVETTEARAGSLHRMVRRFGALLWKWLWCFWAHRQHKCFPTVWGPEQAKEMGIPYRPNAWHCTKCHPCNEGLDRLMEESPNDKLSHAGPTASTAKAD